MDTRFDISRLASGLILAAMLAALAAACAPASAGVDVGDIAPPFVMQLADGSPVALRNLVDDRQPVLMMYFATW